MPTAISIDDIHAYITQTYVGLNIIDSWGEQTYFYNPGKALKRGTYFMTIKEKNGDHDKASDLDREEVFRLNIGLPKPRFIKLFGSPPKRPAKGQAIEGKWHFAKLNLLTPHPVYGWMSWVSVLNPSHQLFEQCKPLIEEAYEKAVAGFNKRLNA